MEDPLVRAITVGGYVLSATPPEQARQVTLDNCGISVVVRQGERSTVSTLIAALLLQGVAA